MGAEDNLGRYIVGLDVEPHPARASLAIVERLPVELPYDEVGHRRFRCDFALVRTSTLTGGTLDELCARLATLFGDAALERDHETIVRAREGLNLWSLLSDKGVRSYPLHMTIGLQDDAAKHVVTEVTLLENVRLLSSQGRFTAASGIPHVTSALASLDAMVLRPGVPTAIALALWWGKRTELTDSPVVTCKPTELEAARMLVAEQQNRDVDERMADRRARVEDELWGGGLPSWDVALP